MEPSAHLCNRMSWKRIIKLKQKLKHSTNLLLNSKTMYTMCSAYNNIISVRAHSQHTSFLHAGHHISIEFVPDMKRTTVIHSCYVIIKVKSFSTSTINIKTMFESWLNVLSNNENTYMLKCNKQKIVHVLDTYQL